MNKIRLSDGYDLIYRYSMTSDESCYSLGIYDYEYYEEEFRKVHHVGEFVKSNGHTYQITNIIDQFDSLFVCLKIIK